MTLIPRATARHAALRPLCLLAAVLLLAACSTFGGRDEPTGAGGEYVPMPSLDALMGDWYVAARVPWFGERGRVASRLHLRVEDEAKIVIERAWRDGFGEPLDTDATTARRDGRSARVWKLRAWRLLPTRLRVLEAAEDGSWLLLDAEERNHAWILTRAQVVSDEAYLELERRIRGHGVNTDRLRRVPQVPEQEGRLGFEPAAVPTPGR